MNFHYLIPSELVPYDIITNNLKIYGINCIVINFDKAVIKYDIYYKLINKDVEHEILLTDFINLKSFCNFIKSCCKYGIRIVLISNELADYIYNYMYLINMIEFVSIITPSFLNSEIISDGLIYNYFCFITNEFRIFNYNILYMSSDSEDINLIRSICFNHFLTKNIFDENNLCVMMKYFGVDYEYLKNTFDIYANLNDMTWISSNYYNCVNEYNFNQIEFNNWVESNNHIEFNNHIESNNNIQSNNFIETNCDIESNNNIQSNNFIETNNDIKFDNHIESNDIIETNNDIKFDNHIESNDIIESNGNIKYDEKKDFSINYKLALVNNIDQKVNKTIITSKISSSIKSNNKSNNKLNNKVKINLKKETKNNIIKENKIKNNITKNNELQLYKLDSDKNIIKEIIIENKQTELESYNLDLNLNNNISINNKEQNNISYDKVNLTEHNNAPENDNSADKLIENENKSNWINQNIIKNNKTKKSLKKQKDSVNVQEINEDQILKITIFSETFSEKLTNIVILTHFEKIKDIRLKSIDEQIQTNIEEHFRFKYNLSQQDINTIIKNIIESNIKKVIKEYYSMFNMTIKDEIMIAITSANIKITEEELEKIISYTNLKLEDKIKLFYQELQKEKIEEYQNYVEVLDAFTNNERFSIFEMDNEKLEIIYRRLLDIINIVKSKLSEESCYIISRIIAKLSLIYMNVIYEEVNKNVSLLFNQIMKIWSKITEQLYSNNSSYSKYGNSFIENKYNKISKSFRQTIYHVAITLISCKQDNKLKLRTLIYSNLILLKYIVLEVETNLHIDIDKFVGHFAQL